MLRLPMAIPTNEEILSALGRLDSKVADDLETQWLEVKPWQGSKEDMKVAVAYAACLANAEGGEVAGGRRPRPRRGGERAGPQRRPAHSGGLGAAGVERAGPPRGAGRDAQRPGDVRRPPVDRQGGEIARGLSATSGALRVPGHG